MTAAGQTVDPCWASGGVVISAGRAVAFDAALGLFALYLREADDQRAKGRVQGAELCEAMALRLGGAIVTADDWRCAQAGLPRSQSPAVRVREFVCQVKSRPYG